MSSQNIKIKLDQKAVNEVCLSSIEIDEILEDLGSGIKSRYGKSATVRLEKRYGKRHRVFIDVPQDEALENNNLLKAMK